jgi:hypothetical protein
MRGLLLAMLLALAACAGQGTDSSDAASSRPRPASTAGATATGSGERLVDVPGHVQRVSDEWWALVPADDPGTRYAPQPPVPPELREDGLAVTFGGVVGELPPGVRTWGTPLLAATVRRR